MRRLDPHQPAPALEGGDHGYPSKLARKAEYQRQWRASKGARTGAPGRPVTAACGTVSAYKRHQRHDEQPCQPCRDAWAAYQRELYAKRQGH